MAKPLIIDKAALLAAGEIRAECDLPIEYRTRAVTRFRFWLGARLFHFAAWVMGTHINLTAAVPRQNVRFR